MTTASDNDANFTTTDSLDALTLHEIWFSKEIDYLIGVILGILTIMGTVENICVFGMFLKSRKDFPSRTSKLLMSLSVSDGIMAMLGGTMFTLSCFNNKWMFGDLGCKIYAFVMYWTGCADIAHLTVIAVDRMMAITSPIRYKAWGGRAIATVVAIIIAWGYGFIWAFFPLIGLQRYAYEGHTSCSIDWLSQKPLDQLYNILIFVFSYFIPLGVMIGSYSFIFITVKASGKRIAGGDEASKKKQSNENKLAANLSISMVLFMMIWTPYAVVSMWGCFGDPSAIPDAARAFPAVFAKGTMALNPLIYVATNKSHRKKMRAFLHMPADVDPDDKGRRAAAPKQVPAPSAQATEPPRGNALELPPELSSDAATEVTKF